MSQYSLVIKDGTGAEVLTALTEAFNAVATLNSGSAAPAETYAFMWWADTTTGLLKLRNSSNTDWIEVGTLDDANLGLLTGDSIGSTVQSHDADLDALSASGAGAKISSYGVNGIGFRNRIINGAMMIDQRNAGASVTPTTSTYTLDRYYCVASVTSKFSIQQNAGSVTPPVGFSNYAGMTSLSAYTVGAEENFAFRQLIEGTNVSDLAWGTTNASPVTLSFWVYSSLTGTFGGALKNSGNTRSYPFTYTISSANTWEYKTVTIAGDTTGTWLTTTGVGLVVSFSLGSGSTYSAAANTWASGNYNSATGATSVVGVNGATFYITGVQLEKGSTATSFDYRPYGTELALCQRYYYKVKPATDAGPVTEAGAVSTTTTLIGINKFPVTMRSIPSAVEQSGTATDYAVWVPSGGRITCSAVPQYWNMSQDSAQTLFTVASGLTVGQAGYARQYLSGNAYLGWSAEL